MIDAKEFATQQFASLRAEVQARQNRMFWTIVIGLLGMPALTWIAMGAGTLLSLVVPLFVLVVIILFLAEQNGMMRVGRYIREHIERHVEPGGTGWEAWLESRTELRLMEKHFFACFISIFFLFYFVSVGVAVTDLWIYASSEASGHYWYWVYGAITAYSVSTLWALATLVHHWKSSVSTSASI